MAALKKNSVAFMIMLLCIVISIVIGLNRKEVYITESASDSKPITTFGVINKAVQDGISAFTDNKTEEKTEDGMVVETGTTDVSEDNDNNTSLHISLRGVIILILVIMILKGKKKH